MSEPPKQQVRRAHIYRFPCWEPVEAPRDLPFVVIGNAAWWTRWIRQREVAAFPRAYLRMRMNQPLTVTVEQAADILGIGRSTAYELVRTGELSCIRLRRRIVVPVAHLAERLGVDRGAVWSALSPPSAPEPVSASRAATSERSNGHHAEPPQVDASTLF